MSSRGQLLAVASEGRQRSKLVPLGFALMIVGIVFPRALQSLASGLGPGPASRTVGIIANGLILCFLVGLGAAIVGLIRNRRMMKS